MVVLINFVHIAIYGVHSSPGILMAQYSKILFDGISFTLCVPETQCSEHSSFDRMDEEPHNTA